MLVRAEKEAEEKLGLLHKIQFGDGADSPVIFLVHGRAGNFNVMSAFLRCIPPGWTAICPQAIWPDPHDGGFSWWDIHDKDGRREGMKHASDRLFSFMRDAISHYSLHPEKRLAAGFSQGAAILSVIIQREPQFFDGVALLAGFVIQDEEALQGRKLPPIFVAHGLKDETVEIQKARNGVEYLRNAGATVTYVEDEVGHKVGTGGMTELRNWLK